MLDDNKIRHLAKIADLTLTESELPVYVKQLTSVFEYVKILDSYNLDGVEPTFQVLGNVNRFQDEDNSEKETLEVSDAIKNSKQSSGSYIVGKSKLKG